MATYNPYKKPPQQTDPSAPAPAPSPTPQVPPPPVFSGVGTQTQPQQQGGLSPAQLSMAINKNSQGLVGGRTSPGPAANTPAGTDTPPAAPPPTPTNEDTINSFYGNLTKQQEGDWQNQQGMLQGQMANFQRQGDLLNARMGGSIAGGYAGLAGAALGQGMEQFNKAALAYNQLRQATGKEQFGALQHERERQEEHTWEQERDTQQLEQQAIQYALENNIPVADAKAAFGIGGAAGAAGATQATAQAAAGAGQRGAVRTTDGWSYINEDGSIGHHVSNEEARSMGDFYARHINGMTAKGSKTAAINYANEYYTKNGKYPSAKEMQAYLDSKGFRVSAGGGGFGGSMDVSGERYQ